MCVCVSGSSMWVEVGGKVSHSVSLLISQFVRTSFFLLHLLHPLLRLFHLRCEQKMKRKRSRKQHVWVYMSHLFFLFFANRLKWCICAYCASSRGVVGVQLSLKWGWRGTNCKNEKRLEEIKEEEEVHLCFLCFWRGLVAGAHFQTAVWIHSISHSCVVLTSHTMMVTTEWKTFSAVLLTLTTLLVTGPKVYAALLWKLAGGPYAFRVRTFLTLQPP